MKLVIDMAALSTDKRKMIVDYLQDNEVPLVWAGEVDPQLDIYSAVANEINSLPTALVERFGQLDRSVGKHPALAAPYLGFDLAKGCDWTATQEWADAEARRSQGFEPVRTWTQKSKEEILADIKEARTILMSQEDFLDQYMCTPKPDPKAWTPHHGGPCPVNHVEVEVELRGDHRPGKDVETRSVKRRGMPESFVWQWGRPTDPTSRNDVLNWRPALPTPEQHREDLIRRLVLQCNLTQKELEQGSNEELVALGRKYRLSPGAWLKLAEPKPGTLGYCPEQCAGSGGRHNWKSGESTIGDMLRCEHCGYRIFGPYANLPSWLKHD